MILAIEDLARNLVPEAAILAALTSDDISLLKLHCSRQLHVHVYNHHNGICSTAAALPAAIGPASAFDCQTLPTILHECSMQSDDTERR